MSTDWDLVCKSHEPNIHGHLEQTNDSGKQALAWTWEHRRELSEWMTLANDSGYADLDYPQVCGSTAPIVFVRMHQHCSVVLRDENGNEEPLPGPTCPACGQPKETA